jgi:purine-binding chemotaxis protein CheW
MSETKVLGLKQEFQESQNTEQRVITFRLNEELIGIDIQSVIKITKIFDITPVPKTPHFILGVMNLRGNIIPIVSLKEKLGIPELEEKSLDELTIVVIDTEIGYIGVIVDKIEGATVIDKNEILPPPMNSVGIDPEFIKGVVMTSGTKKELLILLDVSKIFNKETLR